MQGYITDRELTQADEEFPGIASFFSALQIKPRTFLELVAQFDHWFEGEPRGDDDALPRAA